MVWLRRTGGLTDSHLHRLEAITGNTLRVLRDDRELHFQKQSEKGDGDWIGKFSLKAIPGCYGVLCLHHVQVQETWRRHGIGLAFHRMALAIGYLKQAGMVIATSRDDNQAERGTLRRAGFTALSSNLLNRRSGNLISIYGAIPHEGDLHLGFNYRTEDDDE